MNQFIILANEFPSAPDEKVLRHYQYNIHRDPFHCTGNNQRPNCRISQVREMAGEQRWWKPAAAVGGGDDVTRGYSVPVELASSVGLVIRGLVAGQQGRLARVAGGHVVVVPLQVSVAGRPR